MTLVLGILAADNNFVLCAVLMVAGALIIFGFFAWVRSRERAGKDALLSSAYLQVVRGYGAIKTGVIFTAATVGILVASLAAGALAKRFSQRTSILTGFITTIAGVVFLLLIVKHSPSDWASAPGLLLIGLGLGVMLTQSVNVVQSAFPEDQQSEISGLSRCVSNLGSSLGTAMAGTILISGLTDPNTLVRTGHDRGAGSRVHRSWGDAVPPKSRDCAGGIRLSPSESRPRVRREGTHLLTGLLRSPSTPAGSLDQRSTGGWQPALLETLSSVVDAQFSCCSHSEPSR